MEFKKTVAGISAAAIAVTQVAAVIPMGTFAATEDVASSNVQFALNYKAGGTTKSVTAAAGAKTATVDAADITSVEDFGLSFSGAITNADLADGDKYTFTANGLTVTAKEKDTKSIDKTGTVWVEADGVDLDGTTAAGKLDVENAGAEGDTVTITYTKGETDIKVVDSNGADITNTASEAGKFTFVLTADSASKFTISGDGVTVESVVKVTKKTETTLSIDTPHLTTEGGEQTVTATGGVAGDKVTVTYEELSDASGESGSFSLTIAGVSVTSSPYTFELTADMVENGFKVSGNCCNISEIKLVHTDETDLNKSGEIKDTKTPATVTVAADKFADVALVDGSALTVKTAKTGENNGTITIKAGDVVITEGTEPAESYTLNAEQAAAVKANGLTITGSGIKLCQVDYRVKGETTKGQTITLFSGSDSVVWSETYAAETQTWETLAEDTANTTVSTNALDLGNLSAFSDKYENITATWSELTAVKVTPDPVEPTEVQGTLPFSTETDLSKNYIKFGAVEGAAADGTITVGVKDTDGAAVVLKDADGVQLDTKTVADSETSVVFTLTEEQAAKVAENGFIIAGTKGTVTSVAYKAKEEEPAPVDKTKLIKEIGNSEVDIKKLDGVAKAKITFKVTTCNDDGYGTLTMYAQSATSAWQQDTFATKAQYASGAGQDWQAKHELAGTGEITTTIDFVPDASTDTWYKVGVKTSDYEAVTGELVKVEFLDANDKVVAEYSESSEAPDTPDDDKDTVEIWNGEFDLGEWANNFTDLPSYSKAKKDGTFTINYTVNDGAKYAQLQLNDSGSEANNWKWTDLTEIENISTTSKSHSYTLTEKMADSLKNGRLIIKGANVTLTSVTYKAPASSGEDDRKETVLFEGSTDMGTDWGASEKISAFAAKKGGTITAEFVESKTEYWQLKFMDGGWTPLTAPKTNEWDSVELGKNATTYSFDLNAADAKAVSSNGMVISGYGVTLKKLTYTAPAGEETFELADIKDTNFRNVLKPYSSDGRTLSKADIAKITALGDAKEDAKFKNEAANLAKVKDFAGIENLTALKTLIINPVKSGNRTTAPVVAALDLSENTELTYLDVSGCTKLTSLDVSANTALETLALADVKVGKLDVSANTALKSLNASNCGLTSIDVSTNTALETLNVSKNSLVALNLTGLDALTTLDASGNSRKFGAVVDGEYDIVKLTDEGLKVDNMTIKTENVERNKTVLTGVTGEIEYEYSTGLETEGLDKVTFTLAPEKITSRNFEVSYYDENEDRQSVTCETWNEVIAAMTDKNTEYYVSVAKDVTVDKLTMPAASKAKSVVIVSAAENTKTITTKSASVTLPTDTTFANVVIKVVDNNGKKAKNFTLSASKNLEVAGLKIDAEKSTIKGGSKSVLKAGTRSVIAEFDSTVTGFGSVYVENSSAFFNNTVNVKELRLKNGAVAIKNNAAATFANIITEGESKSLLAYVGDEFKPASVTGYITGDSKLRIEHYKTAEADDIETINFADGDVVLTSKNANLAVIDVSGSVSDDDTYTLARVGSDVKVMAAKMTLTVGDDTAEFAQWSDVISTITDLAKLGNKTADYTVTLTKDLDVNGAFKMPAANTYGSLTIRSLGETPQTVKFTGNISLTGTTSFENVKLDSVKTSKGVSTSYDFNISTGKNDLVLSNVTSGKSIKSISSNGTLLLDNVIVTAVNGATVEISNSSTAQHSMGALVDGKWQGVAAPDTSVIVEGNLTAKTALRFVGNESGLRVMGVVNAAKITAAENDSVLVVDKLPKNKNALIIGKGGFDGSSKAVKFVLMDAEKDETAQITENLTLGTIAGPYADQFIPSDSNLVESDSYYIIKSGKNLVAVPKQTKGDDDQKKDYLVEVTVNGNKAYYKSLDEAIKDISATGTKTDKYSIKLTGDQKFAKLPLPSAGKYNQLAFTADSDIKIDVTSDLTLTGNVFLGEHVFLNKVDRNGDVQPISVNVGKYIFASNAALSGKTADNETYSQINNINGKGTFIATGDITVSGKVNVDTFVATGITTLGNRSAFAASTIVVSDVGENDPTLKYPVSIAKNVKIGIVDNKSTLPLVLDITGDIKSGDQVAALTGNFTSGMVKLTDELGEKFTLARSGNKLVVLDDESNNVVVLYDADNPTTSATTIDSYANAINEINRLKNANCNYVIGFSVGEHKLPKLTLPAKGKYNSLTMSSITDEEGDVVLSVNGNSIALTGNLIVDGDFTLKQTDGKELKFTSAKKKDQTPVYSVTVKGNAKIENGTLNGTEIKNPAPTPVEPEPTEPTVVEGTLPYTGEVDLSANVLKLAKADVVENGTITVTFKYQETNSIQFKTVNGDELKSVGAAPESYEYTWTLSADDAAEIIANGFVVSGTKGIVVKVDYKAPAVKKTEVSVTGLPYSNADGVDLSKNVLKVAATKVVENGTITVTLKANVTSAIVLNDADGNELIKATPDAEASSVAFKLTADQVKKITANGFTITGEEGVVTAITYDSGNETPVAPIG